MTFFDEDIPEEDIPEEEFEESEDYERTKEEDFFDDGDELKELRF